MVRSFFFDIGMAGVMGVNDYSSRFSLVSCLFLTQACLV